MEWDTDPGVQEVQTITTSTYVGANEVQTIATKLPGQNEVQLIKTLTLPVQEKQKIAIKHATSGSFFFLKLDTTSTGGSIQFSGDIPVHADATGAGYSVANIISGMSNVKAHGSVTVTKTIVSDVEFYYEVEFPASMGNVPTMEAFTDKLLPQGEATATISTVEDGNIIGGTFRLSFEDVSTVDLPFDASPTEMREALEDLPGIETVDVAVSVVDDQRGYEWTVEFTGTLNDGNVVEDIKANTDGLFVSNPVRAPDGAVITVTPSDGAEIGGTFTLTYGGEETSNLDFNAESADVKEALESLGNNVIPTGTIAVSRSGPNGEKEYTWTVTFLNDFARTHEGDLNLITFDKTLMTPANSAIVVAELPGRKGTIKGRSSRRGRSAPIRA